jgi:hypothetical protein
MILDGEIVAFDAAASRRSTRCRTASQLKAEREIAAATRKPGAYSASICSTSPA